MEEKGNYDTVTPIWQGLKFRVYPGNILWHKCLEVLYLGGKQEIGAALLSLTANLIVLFNALDLQGNAPITFFLMNRCVLGINVNLKSAMLC